MSVYSQLGLHTRSKNTHAHKHMHQAHAVQSNPSSQLSHSPLDESFWAQPCSQPNPLLAATLLAACVEVCLILGASLGNNGWVSQPGTGEVWQW